MRKLISLAAVFGMGLTGGSAQLQAGQNDGWVVVGRSRKTNAPSVWIKLRNAEQINEDSFKFMARLETNEVESKINCKNKDIGIKGQGYQQIAAGTAGEGIAEVLCRFIPAREYWGMSQSNASLWNGSPPQGKPADAKGNWIEFISNEKNEEFYNERVASDGKTVLFARYTRDKKQDSGERTQLDVETYRWIKASCLSSDYAVWAETEESYFTGFWQLGGSARPNSSIRLVTKEYCSKPNTAEMKALPLPTVQDLRKHAD